MRVLGDVDAENGCCWLVLPSKLIELFLARNFVSTWNRIDLFLGRNVLGRAASPDRSLDGAAQLGEVLPLFSSLSILPSAALK